jgi:hypothetical protein
MSLGTIFVNFIFSLLILFTGPLGMLIIRIVKGKWKNVVWSYIPIFWIPIVTSWPVAIAALIGKFDD